jgi:mono/diheme cytochrome c family protein
MRPLAPLLASPRLRGEVAARSQEGPSRRTRIFTPSPETGGGPGWGRLAHLGALLLSLLLPACEGPPPAEGLKEWTPADHRSVDDDKGVPQTDRGPQQKGSETADLVDLAWRQQCSQCHGPMGRGDGPTGPMTHPPDLTNLEWQAKTSDDEIVATIKNGKNKMPKFELPDEVIAGLLGHVRQLKGR